eukprot:2018968-Alexandrium_andersonii.AAC.1
MYKHQQTSTSAARHACPNTNRRVALPQAAGEDRSVARGKCTRGTPACGMVNVVNARGTQAGRLPCAYKGRPR